jgi:predicted restriction endonuclease
MLVGVRDYRTTDFPDETHAESISDSQLTTPQAEDLELPPVERVETTVSRILRDTQLSNRVKALHNYECQLCGFTLLLADGSRYAEGHHIQPLGSPHNGPDVLGNIVCLCPNHHAACDLGAIKLVRNELRAAAGHVVGRRYIDYHNSVIYRGSKCAAVSVACDRTREDGRS